jgi:hypothetical protein
LYELAGGQLDALREYELAYQQEPTNLNYICGYAGSLMDQNQLERAEPLFASAAAHLRSRSKSGDSSEAIKLAKALRNLAEICRRTYRLPQAEAHLNEAVAILKSLPKPPPSAVTLQLARTLTSLGVALTDANQQSRAEELFSEAIRIQRSIAGINVLIARADLARSLHERALNLSSDQSAARDFSESLSIRVVLARDHPILYKGDYAESLQDASKIASHEGNFQKADGFMADAIRVWRELAAVNPDAYQPRLADSLLRRAFVYTTFGRLPEGLASNIEGLGLMRQLSYRSALLYRPAVAQALEHRSRIALALGEMNEFERSESEALAIWRTLAAADPIAFQRRFAEALLAAAVAQVNSAISHVHKDWRAATAAFCEEAHTLHKDDLPSEIREATEVITTITCGYVHYVLHQFGSAEQELFQLARIERDNVRFKADLPVTLFLLGAIAEEKHQYADGVKLITEALQLQREAATTSSFGGRELLGEMLSVLGDLTDNIGNSSLAERYFLEEVSTFRQLAPISPSYRALLVRSLRSLGWFYAGVDKDDSAFVFLDEALSISKQLAQDDPRLFGIAWLRSIESVAAFHCVRKHTREAEEYYRRLLEAARQLLKQPLVGRIAVAELVAEAGKFYAIRKGLCVSGIDRCRGGLDCSIRVRGGVVE